VKLQLELYGEIFGVFDMICQSKDLLYINGIFIPTPTSKPPFIKVLSIYRIIDNVLKNTMNKY